jgi:hypothetical protein
MPVSLASAPALPPAIDSYLKRALVTGAAPLPLVELNTQVAGLGPFVVDYGGRFSMTVYAGPTMHFAAHAKLGTLLDASA